MLKDIVIFILYRTYGEYIDIRIGLFIVNIDYDIHIL